MAQLRSRTLSSGEIRYRVEWREGGRYGTPKVKTFSDDKAAIRFRDLVEALGNSMPDDTTLRKAGFSYLIEAPRPGIRHSDQSLVEYAHEFIARLEDIGEQQTKTYESYVRLYLEPHFGATRITAIVRADMRAWQRWMSKDRKLSNKTIANVRGLLIPLFADTCLRGDHGEPALRDYSPMDGLKAKKPQSQKRHVLRDAADARLFYACAYERDPEFADLLFLSSTLACRWGELIALMDDAVFLGTAPIVQIKRVGKRITGRGWVIEDAPKTEAGYRELPLTAHGAAILEERLLRGVGLLFPGPTGKLFTEGQNVWQKRWDPLVQESMRRGLRYRMTIHGLRKTTLTMLAQAGVNPVLLKEFAGHKSAVTTLDLYTESTGVGRDTLIANVTQFLPDRG